jgi:hypothetical protein
MGGEHEGAPGNRYFGFSFVVDNANDTTDVYSELGEVPWLGLR